MSKKSNIGDDLLELEKVLDKMVYKHGLQMGDVLALVWVYLTVHCSDCIERYVKGGKPEFYYGPRRDND